MPTYIHRLFYKIEHKKNFNKRPHFLITYGLSLKQLHYASTGWCMI